jgi:polyisoprenyl-phosphate glycosyltransferase
MFCARLWDAMGVERSRPVSLDVVVPFLNEEQVLSALLERLTTTFSPKTCAHDGLARVHFVLVDDGSTDQSAQLVTEAIRQGAPATLVRLSRNFGHQNAVSAGLAAAGADVVAVIDADLQDPPELILTMLERWRAGFDVVYAIRRRRQAGMLKRIGYWLFYRLLALLSDVRVPLDSGDFCLLDRRVVQALETLPERLRFPRILRAWVGFPQTGVEFDRPDRVAGRAKYTLANLYRLATDGVVAASVRPLQLAQVFSVGYLLLSVALVAVLLTRILLYSVLDVPVWVVFLSLLVLSGNFVQSFCLYILGAYVGRTYLEAKGRPPFIVMEVVGRPQDGAPSRVSR